jgi:hypothetical protein
MIFLADSCLKIILKNNDEEGDSHLRVSVMRLIELSVQDAFFLSFQFVLSLNFSFRCTT